MKSLPVPAFTTCCRLSQLLSHARAEIDCQRAVPRPAPTASLAAAAAVLPFVPLLR